MDRRRFIQTSGALAGGIALGVSVTQPVAARPRARMAELGAVVGWINNDLDPSASTMANFGDTGGFFLDCLYRSVGADLGTRQRFSAVELISDRPSHRLNTRDLAVYTSDDNLHWTKRDSEYLDLGATIWLYGMDIEARYVKVHCFREGAGTTGTFGSANTQLLMAVHRIPVGAFVAGTGSWAYRTTLKVTNSGSHLLKNRAAYITLSELGTASMIANGMLQADLSDLRFADTAGRQLHAYCDGDGIFIRVPQIGPGENQNVFAYSGNPTAQSVLSDAGALQVEYGHRTYQFQGGTSAAGLTFGTELHPVRLPDGTLMLAANTTATGGIHARYSFDDGRTWTIPEPLISPSNSAVGRDYAGGFLVDPDTGVVTAILYALGVSSGSDWINPAQHLCQIWIAQANQYVNSRPVFGTSRKIPIINHETGNPASWAITYTNPVKTSSGAYVVTIPHIFRPDGQFALAIIRSTDGGATWTQSATPLTMPVAGFEGGVSESVITQLRSGALVIYARQQDNGKYYFGTSKSVDDGVTWTPMSDSTILASNTNPTVLSRTEDLLLGWPGHNAFGQKSYRRNNMTLAYSRDDGQTFQGYHDIAGATELSTPGWKDATQQRQMFEAFIVPAGTKDLLVGWASALQAGGGATMLIEDIDRYLYDSHGALDVVRHIRSAAATSGTELAQARWWRNTAAGSLTLVPGPRAGIQAVRLQNSDPAVATGASRLFPGTRSGRLRFRFRWNDLGATMRLALQEGFATNGTTNNVGANARGTAAIFELTATGSVTVTTDDAYDGTPVGGYLELDSDPTKGNLGIGVTGAVALDYNGRSAGLDLHQPREITSIVLTGLAQFATGGTSTRLQPSDLRIWKSNTNYSDWEEVTGWSGTKNGLVMTFTGPAFTSRFVKISQPYTDKAFTYANLARDLITVLPARPDIEDPQQFVPLQTPTTLSPGDWHTLQLDFDLDSEQIVMRIDGNVVSQLPTLRNAETITHLLLLTGTGGTTDVSVAELIVQDSSLGLPSVSRVAARSQRIG